MLNHEDQEQEKVMVKTTGAERRDEAEAKRMKRNADHLAAFKRSSIDMSSDFRLLGPDVDLEDGDFYCTTPIAVSYAAPSKWIEVPGLVDSIAIGASAQNPQFFYCRQMDTNEIPPELSPEAKAIARHLDPPECRKVSIDDWGWLSKGGIVCETDSTYLPTQGNRWILRPEEPKIKVTLKPVEHVTRKEVEVMIAEAMGGAAVVDERATELADARELFSREHVPVFMNSVGRAKDAFDEDLRVDRLAERLKQYCEYLLSKIDEAKL